MNDVKIELMKLEADYKVACVNIADLKSTIDDSQRFSHYVIYIYIYECVYMSKINYKFILKLISKYNISYSKVDYLYIFEYILFLICIL